LVVSTAGSYSAVCSNGCGNSASSNVVTLSNGVVPSAPVVVSSGTSLCGGESISLSTSGCNGTIKWNTGASGNVLVVSTAGSYSAVCSNGCGNSASSNVVTLSNGTNTTPPTLTANKSQVCANEEVTLTATGCSAKVMWSDNQIGNTIKVYPKTTTTYFAKCITESGCSSTQAQIVITVNSTIANLQIEGPTEICEGAEVTLKAIGCNSTVTWSNGQTGSSIKFIPTDTKTYVASCGESTIQPSVCDFKPGTITFNAVGGSKGPNIETRYVLVNTDGSILQVNATPSFANVQKGTYKAIAVTYQLPISGLALGTNINTIACVCMAKTEKVFTVCENGGTTGCNPSGQITIKVVKKPTITISADKNSLCGTTDKVKLTASGCEGTIQWSNNQSGTTIDVNSAGAYFAKCTNICGVSNPSNSVNITSGGNPSAPQISATKTEICNETVLISATGCSGEITWSNNQKGNAISVNVAGTYTATCADACGTSITSNQVVITQNCATPCDAKIPVIAANKTSICGAESVQLSAVGCTNGNVIWSSGQSGNSITVKPVTTSTYSAVCKVSETCISKVSNTIQISVNPIAPPKIGCSSSYVCVGESSTLNAYGCEGTVVWSTGATGNSIIVIPDGITQYTAKCKIGNCESESSEPHAIPVGKPTKPFVSCKNTVLCEGGQTTLTASGCNGIIKWSTGVSGSTLTVSPTQEITSYSAVCISLSGKCESDKSNEIQIVVGKKVQTPKVLATVENICPYNSVDLNTVVLGDPSTKGGQFEFHTTNSPTSLLVTNPSAVVAGTYYVFERSAVGCYSEFATVTAKVNKCDGGIDPANQLVDIAVRKTAKTKYVSVNQNVVYEVVVKNVGKLKATGIIVRDVLPTSLNYVKGSANVSYAGGIIKMNIDALNVADSVAFTYETKVVASGKIVNKAELYKVNEQDNVLTNNSSEFTINDPMGAKMIGISKQSGKISKVRTNVYNVPFILNISNMGGFDIKGVQVKDDLDKAFANGAKILNDTITVTADKGLVVNPKFTGRGANISLLIDSLSSIKKGEMLTLKFNVQVDISNTKTLTYFNSAEVIIAGKTDVSSNGMSVDPDGDGDPSNNEDPTPINFNEEDANAPAIGVALSVAKMKASDDDNCHEVTYLALVKNVGKYPLKNVQVSDSLYATFGDSATYQLVEQPSLGKKSTLKLNPNFNGKDDVNLLVADSTSTLAVDQSDSIFVKVKVCHNGNLGPYNSLIYGKAIGNGLIVTDISNNGIEVQPDSTSPTPVKFSALTDKVVIPEGFSPNGDGKNDNFVIIPPAGVKIEYCEIYNRWGQLVYKDPDGSVITTTGWNGVSNQGIRFGTQGLPDGTYYYTIKVSGETETRINFITIAR